MPSSRSRLQDLLWPGALGLCATAAVVHVVLARDRTVEPIAALALWLATGVALAAHARGACPSWIPRAGLTAVGVVQLAGLRHFSPVADHPASDFGVVFESAVRLYRDGGNPYADPLANSFPFPIYLLVYAIARGSGFDARVASQMLLGINVAALGLAVSLLARLARHARLHGAGAPSVLLWLAVLTHPGVAVTLRNGQTSLLVLVWVALALWWWLGPRPRSGLAGLFVTLAWMTKPYLLVLAAFFVVERLRAGHRDGAARVGEWVVAWSAGLLLAVLAWPGGVGVATFGEFAAAVTRLQHHYSLNLVSNQSALARLAARAAERPGLPYAATIDVLAACAIVTVVGLNLHLLRRRRGDAAAALAWLAATLVPYAILYVVYYTWIVPVLYVLAARAWTDARRPLYVLSVCATAGTLHLLTSPGFTAAVVALWLTALGAAVATPREPVGEG